MDQPLRILLVEDVPLDAELVQREVRRSLGVCVFLRVDMAETYVAALTDFQPDLIISDYWMPRFDGLRALRLLREVAPHIPLIILTGSLDETIAVSCMKAGAADYVLKEQIRLLGPAAIQALQTKQLRQEHHYAEEALRRSEARYRALVRALPDPLIVADLRGRITFVSPLALQMFGFADEQGLLGRQVLLGVLHDDRRRAYADMRAALAGHALNNCEYQLLRKDRSIFFGMVSAASLHNTQGAPEGLTILVRDISERVQADLDRDMLEEQLRHSQKMESIGRLASGVAHDFNNFLTVISGYVDLIQQRLMPDDPLQADLHEIVLASSSASALVRQLLAFSRKQAMRPTLVDLNQLIVNMQGMLGRLINERISFRTDLQSGLWPIYADINQIEQVIMNLVVNARDAMSGGGTLTLVTRNHSLSGIDPASAPAPGTGASVRLVVSDTGVGMDAATQARIFEPFFTTKALGYGTGLGLSTVYGIVKQSGGEITVISMPQQGTSFSISWPVGQISREVGLTLLPLPTAPRTAKILVLDAHEPSRQLIHTALEPLGYTIVDVTHSPAALALLEQRFDDIALLLVDVDAPHSSGQELIGQLQARWPGLKILAVSANVGAALMQPTQITGTFAFLPRPFVPQALVEMVRQMLA